MRPTILLACVVLALVAIPAAASALTVTSVSPAVSYTDSARTYDIYGTGFSVGAQVTLTPSAGGAVIAATGEDWVDFTHLRCTVTVPAGAVTGLYGITVTNPRGTGSGSVANAFTVYPRPTVTSISSPSGAPGAIVTDILIGGTNFVPDIQFRFQGGTGGTTTIVSQGEIFISSTRVRCTIAIPHNAYPGSYDVYVAIPGLDYIPGKADAFSVIAPTPTITGLTPASADAGKTPTVDVSGSGFANGAEVIVQGGPSGSPTMIYATGETFGSPNHIQCTLPIPSDAYIGSYTAYVRNVGGEWVYKLNAFTVTAPTPTITGFSPTSAPIGTTVSTFNVYGSGFARGAEVELQGGFSMISATDENWVSPTQIRCSLSIPADARPGPYNVGVINPGKARVLTTTAFTVTAPTPTITGILPDHGIIGERVAPVYISGTGFANGAEVELWGGPEGMTMIAMAYSEWINSTTIQCDLRIPFDAPPGPYDVYVWTAGADSAYKSDAFTVIAPTPAATGISPSIAHPGDTLLDVFVSGTGLANGEQVRLRGGPGDSSWIDATSESWYNRTTILCDLPVPDDAYPGPYRVCIGDPEGSVWFCGSTTFTVTAPTPAVTGISPASAYPGETLTSIYISGTGFARGASVSVGPPEGFTDPVIHATNETFVNTTAIRCSLAIPADAPPGLYSVSVANIGNHLPATRGRAFTVLAPTPVVTAISPDSAAPGGLLNPVIVSGNNFTTGARVTISGGTGGTTTIEATGETFVGPTQIRCSLAIPADAYPGPYTVTVTNPPAYFMNQGPTGSRDNAFTVIAPVPTLTGIVPSTGTPGQTLTTVNVTGTGFATGANVILRRAGSADIQATDEIVAPPSLITCRIAVPSDAATGSWNVVVTNLGGPSGTLSSGFTVAPDVDTTPPASVTDLRPLSWNATSITWVWTDPPDADFAKVRVYQDGDFKADVDRDVQTHTLTGLAPSTGYQLNTRTCDLAGNFNATLVSNWATTAPRPVGPVADFTANVTSGPAPLAVRFTDASTGTPTSWSWTFGDGGTSTLRDPSHTYTSAGTYTVTLDVLNGDGSDSEVKTGFISVTAPPGVVMVPGGSGIPRDLEPDGLYEDVNGNGRKDFADVVLYFNQMTWIAAKEPASAFDYNGNGRIDFADVVWLFNHL